MSQPLGLGAYRLLVSAAEPLSGLLLNARLKRGKEVPERIGERRGVASADRPQGRLVWLHAASVGELNSVLPLIERLRERGLGLLVTTGTVTSSRIADARLPAGVVHQFVPLDVPAYARRFLDHWRPGLALFVESDLWPNLLSEAAARGAPIVLVNARLSERSFRRWRRMPATIANILQRFSLTLARTDTDAERLRALGALRLVVTGDLKLDVPAPSAEPAALTKLKDAVGTRPVIAAASTHPGEEGQVIAAHKALRERFPNLLSIVAPRHPERGADVAELMRAADLRFERRSSGALPDAATEIYIADTLGELGLLYRVAPLVFIGGSLVRHGGQNPIEAAKLGATVLHGPHVWNFAEVYHALGAAQGAMPVGDADALTARFAELLADAGRRVSIGASGRSVVEALGGGLDRVLAALEPHLAQLQERDRVDA